jgi:glycosyltransferase involved in cell wall biosynthesis
MPVIATPVGGLMEQVKDGINGVLAARTDAPALKDAVKRFLLDPELFDIVRKQIAVSKSERSMAHFVEDCIAHVLGARSSLG